MQISERPMWSWNGLKRGLYTIVCRKREAGVAQFRPNTDPASAWSNSSEQQLSGGLPALIGGIAAIAIGQSAIAHLPLGPRSAHMAAHILTMNAAAPGLAVAVIALGRANLRAFASGRVLVVAAVLQITLLWTSHAPRIVALSFGKPWTHAIMQATLLAASLAFWLAVLSEEGVPRWRAVVAVLLTGKLFCLLGALLLFAPRLLYADVTLNQGHGPSGLSASLADQQAAGLMMLAACPLCYAGVGIAIAARWMRDLESADNRDRPMTAARPAFRA